MKVMKLALLGTAALAAVSVSARADDLSALKAQIEALNGRISQLEAAPAVPAGYQLLSMSEQKSIVVPSLDVRDRDFLGTANTISILPTADMPASTVIQWSGYARAALVYRATEDVLVAGGSTTVTSDDVYDDEDSIDVYARGHLKVVGTTDTSVGEVGAQIQFRGNFEGNGDASVIMTEAWGWWKMTPELTLGGGYTGSLANIGYGYDGACNCYYTDNADVAFNPGDATQMRLSWGSGPMSFAIALEDADTDAANGTIGGWNDTLGVAGEIKYGGDTFSAEVAGGWWGEGDTLSDAYQIGVGLGFNMGDVVNLSMGAAMGHTHTDDDWWGASILASANLSDAVHAEVAYGHKVYDNGPDVDAILAGIYYDPVSQLTIGLEGEWYDDGVENMSIDLVTVYRF